MDDEVGSLLEKALQKLESAAALPEQDDLRGTRADVAVADLKAAIEALKLARKLRLN